MYSVFLKYIIFLFGTQILIINSAADRLSKYGYSDDHEGVSKLLKNLNNDYDADLINDLIRIAIIRAPTRVFMLSMTICIIFFFILI